MTAALDVVLPGDVIRTRPLAVVPSHADARIAAAWRAPSSAPRAEIVPIANADHRAANRVTSEENHGCYRRIVAWPGRQDWLAGLQLYLRHHPAALSTPNMRDSVSHETFMVVVAATVHHADDATGRSIRAHKATVARMAGCSEATVQRVWRIADRRLGILPLIVRARPLTITERMAVRHGPRMPDGTRCRQRGVTALRAAHTPPWLHVWIGLARPALDPPAVDNRVDVDAVAVGCASLPRRASPDLPFHLPTQSPCGRSVVSLRSTQRPRSARRINESGAEPHQPPRRARKPRQKLAGERLAAELAARLPWAAHLSPRRSAPILADYECAGWTATDWIDAAREVLRTIGWTMPKDGIHSPGGFIRWLTGYMTPTTVQLVACGRPECDGHGWIHHTDPLGLGLLTAVAPCPHCPPALRGHIDVDEAGVMTPASGSEPRF